MMQVLPLVAAISLIATSAVAQAPQGAAPARQSLSAAQTVYERHVAEMKAGNLEGVVADYADDAVLVVSRGAATKVLTGKAEVRSFFASIGDPKNLPRIRAMEATSRPEGPDSVVMRWAQSRGTPQFRSGTDVFVVRDNKIVLQTVTSDATPTWP